MTDVAEIARSLTKAQREAFIRDTRSPDWEPPMWLRALFPELISYHWPPTHDGFKVLRWTPLGLAVRAYLTQEQPR